MHSDDDDNIPNQALLTHRPAVAPTINTAPDVLEMPDNDSQDTRRSNSRVKLISSTIERTVDKLSSRVTNKSTSPPPTSSSSRRVFSLSRKSKNKGVEAESSATLIS